MNQLTVFLLLILLPTLVRAEPDLKGRGPKILRNILSQKWAAGWEGSTLQNIRLVPQKEDLAQATGLPPVWHAEIAGPTDKSGYLMWDHTGEGRLVEFALDDDLPVDGAIEGLPTLQQFPFRDDDGQVVASGCVPTSAASLVAYWLGRKDSLLKIDPKPTPEEITVHLRQQIEMVLFPDHDGFTENGMPLAGALPGKLAQALSEEAAARQAPIEVRHGRFTMEHFAKEIAAGRPALLSCTVRVPHKPRLSWGHAVVGLASARIDGVDLVGIHDNFYPTQHPETIRWIRADAFRSLTVVKPREERVEEER